MNKEKLYGLYPASLNRDLQNKLYTFTEEQTFKLIYYIESEIFWMTHEDRNFLIDKEEMIEKTYALEYVIYSTTRFGIKFKQPTNQPLEKNDDYQNWYNYWHDLIIKNQNNHKKIKR